MHHRFLSPSQDTPASTASPSVAASTSTLLAPCSVTQDEAAVIHASTYALWEQLYSTAATSLSVERLMYLRTMANGSSSHSAQDDGATGVSVQQAQHRGLAPHAPTWAAVLFPVSGVAADVTASSDLAAPSSCSTANAVYANASPVLPIVHVTPAGVLHTQAPSTPTTAEQSRVASANAVASSPASVPPRPSTTSVFPPSPLPPHAVANTCATATAAMTVQATASSTDPTSAAAYDTPPPARANHTVDSVKKDDGSCGCVERGGRASAVLQPQSHDCRRRTALMAAMHLTPVTVSSPPDRVLPPSTSEVGSASVTLVSDTLLHSCDAMEKMENEAVPVNPTESPATQENSEEEEEEEGNKGGSAPPPCLPPSPTQHAVNSNEEAATLHSIESRITATCAEEEEGQQAAVHTPTPAGTPMPTSEHPSNDDEEALPIPRTSSTSSLHTRSPLESNALEHALEHAHVAFLYADEAADGEETLKQHSSDGDNDGGEDDDDTGLVSLRTSPAATAAAAVPSGPVATSATPHHHRSSSNNDNRPLTPASPSASASPLADRDGLVLSPPRRLLLQLRLQRRRRREPSDGAVSRPSAEPPLRGVDLLLSPSRSPSTTPAPTPTVVDEDEEGNAFHTEQIAAAEAAETGLVGNHAGVHSASGVGGGESSAKGVQNSAPTPAVSASSPSLPPLAAAEETTTAMSPAGTMEEPKLGNVGARRSVHSPENRESVPPGDQRSPSRVDCDTNSCEAAADAIPETPQRVDDASMVLHADGEERRGSSAATAEIPSVQRRPALSTGLRSPGQDSVGSYDFSAAGAGGGDGVGGNTPAEVRHTAAAVPMSIDAIVERQDRSTDREHHQSPAFDNGSEAGTNASTPSVSPAPLPTSPASQTSTPPPTPQQSQQHDLHVRRSVSTMDFTWAEEADEALRLQQRRLYSQSLAKNGRSPSVTDMGLGSRHGAEAATSTGLAGPHAYYPLQDSSIGLRSLSRSKEGFGGACRETSASRMWRVSPQPQDPRVRFSPATTTTTTSTSPSALATRVPATATGLGAGGKALWEGFASPMRAVSSSPPPSTRLCQQVSSPATTSPALSPQPRRGRHKLAVVVAGGKRPRDTPSGDVAGANDDDDDGTNTTTHLRSIHRAASVSPSPLPLCQARADTTTGRVNANGDVSRGKQTRRGATAGARHQATHHTAGGGGETKRRCHARAQASATSTASGAAAAAAAMANEFVLPRTVLVESAPSAAATRAASPLQPRSVNIPLHRSGEHGAPSLSPTAAPSKKLLTADSAQCRRPAKKIAAVTEGAGSGSGSGWRCRTTTSAVARRKHSIVDLKTSLHQLKQREKEN